MAAVGGNITRVMELFHEGYRDINAEDTNTLTALHLAVFFNSTEVVKLLLQQHDIDVNAQTTLGDTPLHLAALIKRSQCMTELLSHKGINLTVANNDTNTALHLAAMSGCSECIRMIIQYNIDINVKGKHKWTPLHYAAMRGMTDCVNILLLHPDIKVTAHDEVGRAPFLLALNNGHVHCVDALLQHQQITLKQVSNKQEDSVDESTENDQPESSNKVAGKKEESVEL